MNFHFPLMPRMFMSVQMEDRFPIIDILRQTPALPPNCQWATFLRNHDELTLEMVTDEERDYMYRVYTEDPVARINLGIRRRLAPLLRSRRTVELMNAMLFALPGTPVLYYGDEIGMGDNVYLGDRDGVRTPMQWSSDRNAGFSRANPQRLYLPVIIDPEYHYESVNVEAQEANPASLLWWMKRLIDLRRQHPAFGRGGLEFLSPENPHVLAFVRDDGAERLLVVANLSRFPQHCELDLARWAGTIPTELLGRSQFPVVTERPYPLSLGPHGFYWFALTPAEVAGARDVPTLAAPAAWTDVLADRRRLADVLARYAAERRWFRGKARRRRAAAVADVLALPSGAEVQQFVILEIEYTAGEPERYVVPLAFVSGEQAAHLEQSAPHAVVARVELGGQAPAKGVLYDSLATGDAASALLAGLRGTAVASGEVGGLAYASSPALRDCCGDAELTGRAVRFEQTNSTVPFGDKLMLKVFRQLEPGVNAEIEVGAYLTEHAPGLTPRVLGSVTYEQPGAEPTALAVAHAFVANQGTAWDLFADHVDAVFDQVLTAPPPLPPLPPAHVLDRVGAEAPAEVVALMAGDLRHARRIGQRTGEIHALFARGVARDFAPERFSPMHQQSLFQGARALLVRTGETLARLRPTLPPEVVADADAMLAAQGTIEARLRAMTGPLLDTVRVRAHGDLHLGQVLHTGDDFMIIDFEGEPARPLRERRYKRSPLRDVAGMLRSFDYVAAAALLRGRQRSQDIERLRPWAAHWVAWMSAAYVAGYLEVPGVEAMMPPAPADRRLLLDFYTLEKCVYEINYELNNRPAWLPIPIRGLLDLLGSAP
jgi:maltose alpha-D-glucosyltransferase/alpha-amylase